MGFQILCSQLGSRLGPQRYDLCPECLSLKNNKKFKILAKKDHQCPHPSWRWIENGVFLNHFLIGEVRNSHYNRQHGTLKRSTLRCISCYSCGDRRSTLATALERGKSFDFTWGTAPGIVICGSERVKKVRQFVTGPEILYEPCQDVVCMLSLLITVIGSSEKEK